MYAGSHSSSSSFESLYRPPRTDEYIRLGKTNLHGISSSRAAGLEHQQSDDFKPGKRLKGLGENKIAILLWVLFAAATSASWVLQYTLQPSDEATEYGFKMMASDTCKRLKSRTNTAALYLLVPNMATAAVATIVAYFRAGLLAPSPSAYQESKGRLYLGVESGRGFLHASWPRKVMYVVLLLASLPLYYLSNSLVSTKYSAYNAYEVLVSTTFFEGRPFDLAGINMTRYDSLRETPTMPSSDLQWPAEYGASDALNSSLARLQREPTLWKNLSRADCVKQFNEAVYTRYRTLVLVTDYDNDSDSNSSNSALAATVLPGYRLKSASSSLIALCPDTYLEAYNGTIHPPETPFLTLDKVVAAPENVTFLSPAQAREWATNRSLSADVSPTRTLERRRPPLVRPTDTFNPMPGRDLCYHYWPDDDRWMPDTLTYRVPQCSLQYCLAEPVETPRMCQVVYSPHVLFILSVVLTFLLTVISIALGLRCAREGLYSREDASEYFRHAMYRPRWSEEFYGKYGGGLRIFHHRRMPWHLFVFSLVVFTYVFVLWGVGGEGGYYPSGPGDETWLFKALALNKALHIVFEVQLYFQDADVRKRFFRVTPDVDYQDLGKKNWGQEMLRKTRVFFKSSETYLKTSLAVRSFLIHTVYELIFITQLMGAAPLEEEAGTLEGSKPLAFTTLGVPGFNERSVWLVYGFVFFNWLVFVGLPSTLLDVIFYATAGRPDDEKEHVMSASFLVLGLVLPMFTATYWHPSYGWAHPFKYCRRSKRYP